MTTSKKTTAKSDNKPPLEKAIVKPRNKKTKRGKGLRFDTYIYKLLKSITQGKVGISRKTTLIMNSFVGDMLERVAAEAGRLAAYGGRSTLSSREVRAALRLVLPRELADHANSEAAKAVALYHASAKRDAT